jgi:hypothetical protein
MSDDPNRPNAPFFPSPTAATVPGIPSAMPPVYGMPVAPMPTAIAPAPYAGPPLLTVVSSEPPRAVLGVRDHYQFGEEAVGQRVQVTILETPAMPADLPPPSKIDPGLEATRVALEAQLARNAIAALPYVPPTATRWFRFSPLELFMEHVLARRLWTVE